MSLEITEALTPDGPVAPLLTIVVIGGMLRLPGLSARSFWFDEAFS